MKNSIFFVGQEKWNEKVKHYQLNGQLMNVSLIHNSQVAFLNAKAWAGIWKKQI